MLDSANKATANNEENVGRKKTKTKKRVCRGNLLLFNKMTLTWIVIQPDVVMNLP